MSPNGGRVTATIHENIGHDLKGFGGFLLCTVCGESRPIGDIGAKLATGWPTHCGYTMRWVTDRELQGP